MGTIAKAANKLSADLEEVIWEVEPDMAVGHTADPGVSDVVEEQAYTNWNLPRLNSVSSKDGDKYKFVTTGKGVNVYILDKVIFTLITKLHKKSF